MDGCNLRDSNSSDHPGRTDRPRTNTDLNCINSGLNQSLRRRLSGSLPTNNIHIRECPITLNAADHIENASTLSVGGIHDKEVNPRLD